MVLFCLVVGRMAGLVRQREKAAARERALTAAGGLLVGATDRDEIVIAALQAVVELGGDQVDARLCRITGESVRVLAIDDRGALADWTVSGEVAALVQEMRRPRRGACCRPTRVSSCACPSATIRSWAWSCARATRAARC